MKFHQAAWLQNIVDDISDFITFQVSIWKLLQMIKGPNKAQPFVDTEHFTQSMIEMLIMWINVNKFLGSWILPGTFTLQ